MVVVMMCRCEVMQVPVCCWACQPLVQIAAVDLVMPLVLESFWLVALLLWTASFAVLVACLPRHGC